MTQTIHPVDEMLPVPRLFALGLQHVLVMYAGAVAVPLVVGRALNLGPADVAFLISADLFVCGIVTLIQSLGATQWFGIRMPVMMGVTFAAVGPMVAIAHSAPPVEAARMVFGTVIAAGFISIFMAPFVAKLARFFPPVVTGTMILVIGITLMGVGINWVFGLPFGPTAPKIIDPAHAQWLDAAKQAAAAGALPAMPDGMALAPGVNNVKYAAPHYVLIAAIVMAVIVLISRYTSGFIANISVLLGIIVGVIICLITGDMNFSKVAQAEYFALISPFHFGTPIFDPVMIVTMVLVMVTVMVESTGMFFALEGVTGRKVTPQSLSAGLRTDGLGTFIGGIFNTFPYTSFSQNVGLVGITGVKSRFVCVAAGLILMVFGLVPKMGAFVESVPSMVLGGAGIVMFGMIAATGVRILSGVDFAGNRNNQLIVAISIGLGMIPTLAPNFNMWMPKSIDPLIHSGIVLASVSAVLLNLFFNGASGSVEGLKQAASVNDH